MALDRLDFGAISEADLSDLIAAGVPESASLEFKRDLYGGSDADVKEFLKDVSSFANAGGGHLLIGMSESAGIATALSPLIGDADKELARLDSLIRDGIEPRVQAQLRAVSITGGFAILIRIAPSWIPPHRVSARKTNRIYVRGSSGAYEASMDEMRTLFTAAATVKLASLAFRDQRLAAIENGLAPVALAAEQSRIVVHIAPMSAFGGSPKHIDLAEALTRDTAFRPMDATSYTPTINFEGLLIYRGGADCFGYTQLYRDGRIESVKLRAVSDSSGQRVIPNAVFERATLGSIPNFIRALKDLGITPPFLVTITLQNVGGAVLATSARLDDDPASVRTMDLKLPPIVIEAENDPADIQRALKPAYDALWNSAGFISAGTFDDKGFWKGSQ